MHDEFVPSPEPDDLEPPRFVANRWVGATATPDAAPTREAYERLREMNRINNDWGLRLHAVLTELRECATEAPADLLERVDELLAEE